MYRRLLHPRRWSPLRPAPRETNDRLGSLRRLELPGIGPEDVVLDDQGRILAGVADGRILRIDPARGAVESVANTGGRPLGLEWCAHHLTGPRAGTHDVLVDNLPGFPDNISLGSDGLIWVTLAAPRDRLLDLLLPRPGVLRQLVWLLPDALKPAPKRTVHVVAVDADGRIMHDLQAPGTDYSMVTGVIERGGVLYLGSLHETAVAVCTVPR